MAKKELLSGKDNKVGAGYSTAVLDQVKIQFDDV